MRQKKFGDISWKKFHATFQNKKFLNLKFSLSPKTFSRLVPRLAASHHLDIGSKKNT
jgi:hypothetical protein